MDDLSRAERLIAIANRLRRARGGFVGFRLAEGAEPGEWVVVVRRDFAGRAETQQADQDAAFLTHVREDVAWLLDEIERLKTEAT